MNYIPRWNFPPNQRILSLSDVSFSLLHLGIKVRKSVPYHVTNNVSPYAWYSGIERIAYLSVASPMKISLLIGYGQRLIILWFRRRSAFVIFLTFPLLALGLQSGRNFFSQSFLSGWWWLCLYSLTDRAIHRGGWKPHNFIIMFWIYPLTFCNVMDDTAIKNFALYCQNILFVLF